MIRVEVPSNEVQERVVEFTRRSGERRSFVAREQLGYAYTYLPSGNPAPHPEKIAIPLQDDQPPYPPGQYVMAPESVYVDRFGKLQIGRLKLRRIGENEKVKAA